MDEHIYQQAGDGSIQISKARDVHIAPRRLPAGTPLLHQLPPPPRDFTGRAAELVELMATLEKENGIIISGLGGVGKTVLALVLAEKLTPSYPDAQFYLNLRGTSPHPLSTADAMAYVIRACQPNVQLPEDEDELGAWFHSVLHGKRAILLMDNAASAKQVAPLIPPSSCVLLVTSRQHFTLRGLSTRKLSPLPPVDARVLLLTAAPRIGDHADMIAELCGYLPLALCLAGQTLADRIDLKPVDYSRRLKDTQQQLEFIDASLSLSYELLSAEMQRLWCMLAVFPDTFDSQAAAAVWDLEPDLTQDALSALVASSLVEWNPITAFYHLHDLVQLFVDARLSEADRAASQEHHARYYLRLACWADPLLATEWEPEALAALDAARPNLLAAQTFLAKLPSPERLSMLFRFQIVLEQYYDRRGLWDEQARMLENSIHVLRTSDLDAHDLGRLEIQLANVYRRQLGDLDAALEYYQVGLNRLYPDGSPQDPSVGPIYRHLGDLHRARGEFTQALTYYGVAEKLLTRECHPHERGKLLSSIAEAYARSGLLERALSAARESLSLQRKVGDTYEIVQSHRILADVHLSRGEIDEAAHHINEARSLFEKAGQERNPLMGWILRTQGEVYRLRSDAESALTCYNQALTLFRRRRIRVGEAIILEKLGLLHLQRGEVESALGYLDQAVSTARTVMGAKYALAETLLSWVEASLKAKCPDDYIRAYLDELTELIKDNDDLAVLRGHLTYVLKRSEIAVGVATSISAAKNFDPQDTLSYAVGHADFRLIQISLNQRIVSDRVLREELAEAAHRQGIRLMCHAPGLLERGLALDSAIIEAAYDLLHYSPEKWVVYHFNEQQPLDVTFDLVVELARAKLVPCIENYHLLKALEKGRQHYELYSDLFRRIQERGLNACAVLDIPRLFDAEVGLATAGEATKLVSNVFQALEDLEVRVLLHLIDSKSFDLDRSNWCPLGKGAIPYGVLLKQMFASAARIDAVIFEFEDKTKPLESLSFLDECIRDGVLIHHPALAVRWWG